jgi:hemerythrin-like metal-binding protein
MDQRPEFGEKFLVGVEQIDREHRRLFDIAARAYDSLGASDAVGQALMQDAVAELIDYTATHFANEEELMAAAEYPALATHREQHRHLLARVRDMEMRVEIEDATVAVDLTHFLYRWLVEHIESSDRSFGDYVRARRPS